MHRITLGAALKSQFDGLSEPVEVCDEAGRTLGHFVPSQSAQARDDCPYTADELDHMRNEQGGRTLPEIWNFLGQQ